MAVLNTSEVNAKSVCSFGESDLVTRNDYVEVLGCARSNHFERFRTALV